MQLQIIIIKVNQMQGNNYWVFSLTCVENSRILYRNIETLCDMKANGRTLEGRGEGYEKERMRVGKHGQNT